VATTTTPDLSARPAAPNAQGHPSKKYMQGIRKREKVVMAIGMVMVRADGTGAEF